MEGSQNEDRQCWRCGAGVGTGLVCPGCEAPQPPPDGDLFAVLGLPRRLAVDGEDLEQRYPSLYRNICDETGAVRRHMNLFVNTSHVRDREGLDTALVTGDVVTILPAISGG